MSKFRRLVRDYERLPETLAGMHWVAFVCIMVARAVPVAGSKSMTHSRRPQRPPGQTSVR